MTDYDYDSDEDYLRDLADELELNTKKPSNEIK